MNRRLQVLKYLLADYFSAMLAWILFFSYRKYRLMPLDFHEFFKDITADANLWRGMAVLPIFWLLLYYSTGFYRKIYRRSRLRELWQTFATVFVGVLIIFFFLILDDIIISYRSYYSFFLVLFVLHFVFTYFLRLMLTSRIVYKIHNRIYGFKTLLVGAEVAAKTVYESLENLEKGSGNSFVGYVRFQKDEDDCMEGILPNLGSFDDLKEIVNLHEIEEIVIATDSDDRKRVERAIAAVEESNVVIKIKPSLKDIIIGSVKTGSVFGIPLITVSPDLMPAWQQSVKRVIDVVFSIIAMILLIPVYVFTAIGVRMSSKGPIFYSQERVGINGAPFKMHKFRSMYTDAEKDGKPKLSSDYDPRITPFGRFMRKVRLDEIPQFYSVLIGDMSLVGPRPERDYFVNLISERAPHYRLLHKIKPGITSWGQVKYGYASSVDEMVDRMKFDLLYLENMSLLMDFKILIYTVLIVLQGRGK
ncbi:MAG: sugar transferase [Bacteroidales bacterium]